MSVNEFLSAEAFFDGLDADIEKGALHAFYRPMVEKIIIDEIPFNNGHYMHCISKDTGTNWYHIRRDLYARLGGFFAWIDTRGRVHNIMYAGHTGFSDIAFENGGEEYARVNMGHLTLCAYSSIFEDLPAKKVTEKMVLATLKWCYNIRHYPFFVDLFDAHGKKAPWEWVDGVVEERNRTAATERQVVKLWTEEEFKAIPFKSTLDLIEDFRYLERK